ncbi:ASPH [Symbiodinium natans]|uniref:ASPH protein n=1 Tax=Symbiodinium natans TaxID=878477 RepID=A0A812RS03_9DINO|nr:ASPH [Symbiodinium natans]
MGERLCVRLHLAPHRRQWTEALNEQLVSIPVLDTVDAVPWPGMRSAIQWLEGNFSEVLLPAFKEARAHRRFTEHGEGLHLTGMWETAHISHQKCQAQLYPSFCKLLQAIRKALPVRRGITQARFARMHPGTRVAEHTASTNQRIKIHCGVENPSNVTMFIADSSITWREGKCYYVDDSYAHHILSGPKDLPRTILELKVVHPDLAWADFLDEETGELIQNPFRRRARAEL